MEHRRQGWKSWLILHAVFAAIVAAGVIWPAMGIASETMITVAGPPDLNRYAEILHDETASTDARVAAARVILSNGFEPEISEALSLLTGQLAHPDKRIRSRALGALGSMLFPNATGFELIARMSRDLEPAIRNQAILSLIRGSENASPEIRRRVVDPAIAAGLAEGHVEIRKDILKQVTYTGASSPILTRIVKEALRDENDEIRASATWIMSLPDYRGVAELMRMRRDTSADVRAAAAYGLGRLRPDPSVTVPVLAEMLDDVSARVRAAAAKALGAFDTAAAPAMDDLRHALKDSYVIVRKEAKSSLSWIEESFGLTDSALLEKLKNPDAEVRYYALDSVRNTRRRMRYRSGPLNRLKEDPDLTARWLEGEILEAVMKATDDPDSLVRANAVRILSRFGPPSDDVIALVASKFDDDEGWVRESASRALVNFGPEARAVIPALIGYARSKNKKIRYSAHKTLRRMAVNLADVAPGLAAVAEEESGSIRQEAVDELRRIAWRSEIARRTLEKLDPHTPGKLVAAPAPTAAGQDVRYLSDDGLRKRLDEPLQRYRPAAGRQTDTILGSIARAGRVDAVEQSILGNLRGPGQEMPVNTVEALWLLDRRQAAFAVPALVELVQRAERVSVREAAAWILGKHGAGRPGVVEALTAATADSYASVRESAALSLARLDAEVAPSLPVLVNSLAELDYPDCAGIGQLLADIDSARAETMLAERLKSDSRNMRRGAICALGGFPRRGMAFRGRQTKTLVDALKGSFGHGSEQIVATRVVRGWGEPFSRKIERSLVAALGDSNYLVRAAALEAFERIGTRRSDTVSAIEDALGDRHPYVRRAAANTLTEISLLSAVSAIRAASQRERDRSTVNSLVYLLHRLEIY